MSRRAALGQAVATVLTGSWRAEPPPLVDADVAAIEVAGTALLRGGAGGLGWWRVRHGSALLHEPESSALEDEQVGTELAAAAVVRAHELASTPTGHVLHEAYRRHAAESGAQTAALVRTLDAMELAGVEVLLVKGWSIARRYPSPGLRPYGDFDLVVRPQDLGRAGAVAEGLAGVPIDLTHRFVSPAEVDGMFERGVVVDVADRTVRVAGREDELRILAVHLVKHGGLRPLWLCDIALLLEQLSPRFDWDACLGRDRRTASYVRAVVAMAVELLGARPVSVPVGTSAPAWAARALLVEWGGARSRPGERAALGDVHGIGNLLRGVRERWPNPVGASFARGVPIRPGHPLPIEVADFAGRAVDFARRRGAVPGAPMPPVV